MEDIQFYYICKIESNLAEIIRGWVAEQVKQHQPRLCCEIDSISLERSVELIKDIYTKEQDQYYFILSDEGGKSSVYILHIKGLFHFAKKMFIKEVTFSVVNPSGFGGCTFDLTCTDDGRYEFFAAAWKDQEKLIENISVIEKKTKIFRGN
ncbi:MAG: hypothetical protein GX654_21885 [Desulfatiglans sp.]|mgnify:CR=1 FL=1|nr:hypothetical protein [Desulfatiglans sp.]